MRRTMTERGEVTRERKHEQRIEASQEFQEFVERVKRHNLRAILTGEALMLAFLALGGKMWERSND